MTIRFDEAKATQAAMILLSREGGRMNYMKLLKLLYLSDRRAIDLYGSPITTDWYVSMDNGPVLSTVLDIIKDTGRISKNCGQYWKAHIARDRFDLFLISDPIPFLSQVDEEVLAEVYAEHGGKNEWQLVDLCHKMLPEWTDPDGSTLPITYEEVMRALGKSRQEIEDRMSDLAARALMEGSMRAT